MFIQTQWNAYLNAANFFGVAQKLGGMVTIWTCLTTQKIRQWKKICRKIMLGFNVHTNQYYIQIYPLQMYSLRMIYTQAIQPN